MDKAPGENVYDHTASGYFGSDDADLSDSISVSAAAQGAGYLGTFTPTVASQTTGGSTGRVEWEFKVNDADLDHLAEGQTVVQQYVVTVDDGHGGTATETVTVTITGSNDAPEIHVRSGDSDAESLDETDTTLTASGTLSLLDVDVIDEVTAARVDSVTKGGTYSGTLPSDADLIGMFTVSGSLDDTETDKTNGISWNFNSGSHYFDGLSAGETLVLTYTVQVTTFRARRTPTTWSSPSRAPTTLR